MIPAEAVEAAVEALRTPGPPYHSQGVMTWEQIARCVLEAAAPYMLAAAWEEGYKQADSDAPHSIKSDNPYTGRASASADGTVVRGMVKDGDHWYYVGSGRLVPPSKSPESTK